MALLYTQEVADRATAWVTQPLSQKRSPAGLTELAALWSAIHQQPSGSCRQCQYSDYSASVAAYLREFSRLQNPTTVASSYSLAPGYQNETFVHEDRAEPTNASNLTDEAAEFYIKQGYGHAIVKNPAPTRHEPAGSAKPPTEKQQLQARFAELFGTQPEEKVTIAQLTEHIEAKEADQAYELPTA